jgi:hypothetical protein
VLAGPKGTNAGGRRELVMGFASFPVDSFGIASLATLDMAMA